MVLPRQLPTPTELISSSKAKYALGQVRIRRGEDELALLSFHGSLEDALRAHLLLRRDPAGEGDWPTMIESLRRDPDKPIDPEQAERLRRMNSLRIQVAHGDRIAVARDAIYGYQQFAASLLVRYDVVVTAPEAPPPDVPLAQRRPEVQPPKATLSQRLFPVVALIAVFGLGVLGFTGLQRLAGAENTTPAHGQPTVIAATSNPGGEGSTASAQPAVATIAPHGLGIGRTAYVQPGLAAGLALRTEPSIAASVPIRVYLEANTAVEVIGGPTQADGYTWWQVRAAGLDGWCAGEFLEVK